MNSAYLLLFFVALAVLVGASPMAIVATAVVVVAFTFLLDKG